MKLRSDIHNSNVTKRGNVSKTLRNKDDKSVSTLVVGVFIFVVIGSAVF